MRNSDEDVHGSGARRSGRTYRQIASLKKGDLFVVHTYGMLGHARMIADMVGLPNLNIMVFWQSDFTSPHKLRGINQSVWVEVDHAARRFEGEAFRQYVDQHNSRVPANG